MKVWIVVIKDGGKCTDARAFLSEKEAVSFMNKVWEGDFPEDVKIFEDELDGGDPE